MWTSVAQWKGGQGEGVLMVMAIIAAKCRCWCQMCSDDRS